MKKALVILLVLTMVMSMVAIVPMGASAAEEELAVGAVAADYKPEGTAINNAEEFAAMAADGNYYLAADIELNATYSENFVGTLDGNGKVITTSVPVFDQVNGTVKNLTLKGYVDVADSTGCFGENSSTVAFAGVLANVAGTTADVAITNVASYATLTSSVNALGGFVGLVAPNRAETTTTFTNCANYGYVFKGSNVNVIATGGFVGQAEANAEVDGVVFVDCVNYADVSSHTRAGGFLGAAMGNAYFYNCVNEGNIDTSAVRTGGAAGGAAGGFVGRIGNHNAVTNKYVFENCVNRGDVSGYYHNGTGNWNCSFGGIVGFAGKAAVDVEFKNCANYGDVCIDTTITGFATGALCRMGGILGETEAGGANCTILMEDCANYGDIGREELFTFGGSENVNHRTTAGGIAGFLAQGKSINVKNCYNYGDVKAKWIAGGIVGIGANSGGTTAGTFYTGCINYGTVMAKGAKGGQNSTAGGISGYMGQAAYANPTFTYCANFGIVESTIFAAGICSDAYQHAIFNYNIVGGKVTSTYEITPVQVDSSVTHNYANYSYDAGNGVTRYFRSCYNGTVYAINGNTVTIKLGSSAYIADVIAASGSTTVTKGGRFRFEHDGKSYAVYTYAAGTITVDTTGDFPTATHSAGYPLSVVEWNFYGEGTDLRYIDLETYDHPVRSAALAYGRAYGIKIDMTKNIVLEGAADVASIQGFQGAFWSISSNLQDYTPASYEDLASGKIAYELNEAIGETVFYQNLDPELFAVDEYPTTDKTHAKIVMIGTALGNEVFDTTNDGGSPATGDAIVYVVIALAVSTLALAGFMFAKKVKEN